MYDIHIITLVSLIVYTLGLTQCLINATVETRDAAEQH